MTHQNMIPYNITSQQVTHFNTEEGGSICLYMKLITCITYSNTWKLLALRISELKTNVQVGPTAAYLENFGSFRHNFNHYVYGDNGSPRGSFLWGGHLGGRGK